MPARRPRLEVLTPRGPGGIAVVAAHGPDRHATLAAWLRTRAGRTIRPEEIAGAGPRVLVLQSENRPVDEVVVVDRPSAGSTELHLHGSEAVLHALARVADLAPASAPGAAEHLLRHALGPEQLALALEQRDVRFEPWLASIRGLPSADRGAALAAARERTRLAAALASPCPVALIGTRNAGKSTLFNRLVFEERALTGDLPGLTRDPVGERTVLEGYPYALLDTAGEGETVDELERRAIELGRRRGGVGLRVLVVDGSRGFGALDRTRLPEASLVVRAKADLPVAAGWCDPGVPWIALSCRDPADSGTVRQVFGAALRGVRGLPPAPPCGVGGPAALDARQRALLDDATEVS